MGDALRDLALNASNFPVGEYAPQKLALIPGDASGTATLRVHVTRRSKLMLGRVVSWKHEQTNGVLRCAGGCACTKYRAGTGARRPSAKPLRSRSRRARGVNNPCSLLFDRPPLVTAFVMEMRGGNTQRRMLSPSNSLAILGGDQCIGRGGKPVACGAHVWSNGPR